MITWRTRFKLFFGVLGILVIVGALTVAFSQRRATADSTSAQVVATEYPVGTDYSGTVVEQYVEEGEIIEAGDPIVTIQSNQLLQAFEEGGQIADNEVFEFQRNGELTVMSSVDGIVGEFTARKGGYASSGSTIVDIASTQGLYVEAEFDLEPTDYARVERGARVDVTFPDGSTVRGTVASIEVETDDGMATTTVRVESDGFEYTGQDGLVAPGTPVQANLQLRHDDALARLIGEVDDAAHGVVDGIVEWVEN